jgi:ribonucleoside-diphosphate reductase alpha chain
MGFHSMLQKRGVLIESAMAKALNRNIFKELKTRVDAASEKLAVEKGPCPDWVDAHRGATFSTSSGPKPQRFACKMAIAPTASISIICGGASAGIDPIPANVYTHKTLDGSFVVKNPYLEKVLQVRLADAVHDEDVTKEDLLEHTWDSILEHGGSVQHLGFLSEHERAMFKTSFELDQRWLLDFAADRAAHVCQSQSLNLFIPADVDKWDLLMLHWKAWEMGIKSLYYLRSMSLQRAAHAGGVEADNTPERPVLQVVPTDYEECLACQ